MTVIGQHVPFYSQVILESSRPCDYFVALSGKDDPNMQRNGGNPSGQLYWRGSIEQLK